MRRHVLDTDRLRKGAGRAAAYLKLDRAVGPHPASLLLQHRTRKGKPDMRLKQYLRVERGHSA